VAPALGLIEPFSGKVYAVSGGGVLRVQQNVKIFIDTLWHFIKLSVAKWCKLPRDAATTNENENK
jgi:hypothetical protein